MLLQKQQRLFLIFLQRTSQGLSFLEVEDSGSDWSVKSNGMEKPKEVESPFPPQGS